MSDRISKVGLSERVVKYASGKAQAAMDLLHVAKFIAPVVEVLKPNFEYMAYDSQNRFRIPDAERAVGGEATQLKTGGVATQDKLRPHALDLPIDQFESAGENTSDEEIAFLFEDAADIVASVGALSWSNKVVSSALTAAGAGTDHNSNTTTLDLVDKIDEQIVAVAKAAGGGPMTPVRVIVGPTAMRRLKNHPLTRGRFNLQTKGGGLGVNPTDADVMGLFIGNPQFKVSWLTYDSAGEGATPSHSFALDDQVLIFAGAEMPTRYDPSFMKTFALRSMWMKPGKYNTANGRSTVFKMDWYAVPKVTNSSAIARINITAT